MACVAGWLDDAVHAYGENPRFGSKVLPNAWALTLLHLINVLGALRWAKKL